MPATAPMGIDEDLLKPPTNDDEGEELSDDEGEETIEQDKEQP